jgi:GntR family transcriptional repressor for pyruvate dehydrogenase complex
MLKPIAKKRLSQDAVDQLREMIIKEKLKPGTRLPSERELIKNLQIGRSSVREALRILEIMGLIEVKPGSGAFVTATKEDLFLPLSSWISHHRETLDHHFEARLVIEPRAAAFAARRVSPKIIKAMKKTLAEFQEKMDSDELIGAILADQEFHRLVAQATTNKTLMLLMDTIVRFLFDGWKATLRVKGRLNKTVQEHQAILKAIERGKPEEASAAMETHLKNALSDLAEARKK